MAVGDVGPPRLVGVDAEVVEELAAAVARHTALADRARMHGDDLLGCAPAAGRAGRVLDEVDRPRLEVAANHGKMAWAVLVLTRGEHVHEEPWLVDLAV